MSKNSLSINLLFPVLNERLRLENGIERSMEYLRKARIGGLIVIERDISLRDYIEKSKKIYPHVKYCRPSFRKYLHAFVKKSCNKRCKI